MGGSCESDSVDPEIFYTADEFSHPELTTRDRDVLNTARRRAARRVCEHCPMSEACLEQNLLEVDGIYAGKTRAERAVLARAQGKRLDQLPEEDRVAVARAVAGDTEVALSRADSWLAWRILEARGMGRLEIAAILDVTEKTVTRWRSGQATPRRRLRSDGAA